MAKTITITVLLSLVCASVMAVTALTVDDLTPVVGQKAIYRVSEEYVMGFEGANVKTVSKSNGSRTTEVMAAITKGTTTLAVSVTTKKMNRLDKSDRIADTLTSYSMELNRVMPWGLYTDQTLNIVDGQDDSSDIGTTILEMPFPCKVGSAWDVGRMIHKDGIMIRPRARAVGVESVSVPAGTYKDCIKIVSSCPHGVEGHFTMNGHPLDIVSGQVEATTWVYPKVGVVKEEFRSYLRLRPAGVTGVAILRVETTAVSELQIYSSSAKT